MARLPEITKTTIKQRPIKKKAVPQFIDCIFKNWSKILRRFLPISLFPAAAWEEILEIAMEEIRREIIPYAEQTMLYIYFLFTIENIIIKNEHITADQKKINAVRNLGQKSA